MQVFALWHGGLNYGPADLGDVELFPSISAAKNALADRARLGHRFPQHFPYVRKAPAYTLTPNADEGAYIDLYLADPGDPEQGDNGIWRRFEIGPRGAVRPGLITAVCSSGEDAPVDWSLVAMLTRADRRARANLGPIGLV